MEVLQIQPPDAAAPPPRIVIDRVQPAVDGGRFPAKAVLEDVIAVTADIFSDGHDILNARLHYRLPGKGEWADLPMVPLGNDRWLGELPADFVGLYFFSITAWVDEYTTYQVDLKKKNDARVAEEIDLEIGARLLEEYRPRVPEPEAREIAGWASTLVDRSMPVTDRIEAALSNRINDAVSLYPDSEKVVQSVEYSITVDHPEARFSAWYEAFPRSWGTTPGVHGTFADCEKTLLPYVADLGFDVLYFPPIHPIGLTRRKGRNNSTIAEFGDPGSPWAIGSPAGGFKAVNPELGTMDDFRHLVAECRHRGIELALDIALQCSADHPYLKEHLEWFKWRPDGTVQYAENPPKKYEDIYPFNFETPAWRSLWQEMKSIFFFWIEQGVRVFRVDNPHTKPFAFWEWLIAEIKLAHPDVILLSEAFTRPKIMYRLAKLGFSQSYTYFTWRNSRQELTEYFTELTAPEVAAFFRPNLWPNTPDILHRTLQQGGRPAFLARLVLAATLGSNYGVYGPAFELMANTPRAPGSEEYLGSEKYEVKSWDISRPDSLAQSMKILNFIRRAHQSLQSNDGLVFHETDNDYLIVYSKSSPDASDTILVAVNLDNEKTQSGWIDLKLEALGLEEESEFLANDLLDGQSYRWRGGRNYIELTIEKVAHIFHLELLPLSVEL